MVCTHQKQSEYLHCSRLLAACDKLWQSLCSDFGCNLLTHIIAFAGRELQSLVKPCKINAVKPVYCCSVNSECWWKSFNEAIASIDTDRSVSSHTHSKTGCVCALRAAFLTLFVSTASGASDPKWQSPQPGLAAHPQRDGVQEDQSAWVRSFRHCV